MEPLAAWIRRSGGIVHEGLELRGSGPTRGIFTNRAISKGEMLILLPKNLALSGEIMPSEYLGKAASSWLRTIAALYKVQRQGVTHFGPYLECLPSEFDSLLNWTDEEVSAYLAGTTLGGMVQADRDNDALEACYTASVRPYLEHLHIVPSTPEENETREFGRACRCISSRGFHLLPTDDTSSNLDADSGPFLLPLIDLINHDTTNKCTTLRRGNDSHSKQFHMLAERDILAGEEVLHSYGDYLTAAQFLQTFGVVPLEASRIAVSDIRSSALEVRSLTPAVLSKASVVQACRDVIQSDYPNQLVTYMKTNKMQEDEVWDVFVQNDRDFSIVPDDIIISSENPLPDELVTLCCLALLPLDAYKEIFLDSPVLLDRGILEDYFLGKLVSKVLLETIAFKRARYCPLKLTVESIDYSNSTDKDLLSLLLLIMNDSDKYRKARFGLTVRLEEKASLESLRIQILELLDFLDDGKTFGHRKQISE